MAGTMAIRKETVPAVTSDHYYWPCLGERLASDWSNRRLLGLPDSFTQTRQAFNPAYLQRRLTVRPDILAREVEDPTLHLSARLSAGQLLALVGDPRIAPLNPPMCDVPGGTVVLGLDPEAVDQVMAQYSGLGLDRSWIEKETPRYTVELRPFRIGRYPVTNLEYAHFLRSSSYGDIPTGWTFGRFPEERANHPVYSIKAEAADAYAAWLSEATGRAFRLPREAEWEYAAGGAAGTTFPWGDSFLPNHANTVECGLLNTSPVGAFPLGASCFGATDMAGNVEEYVADSYAPYPGGTSVGDDLTKTEDSYRVARGGSFARFRDLARIRRRHGRYPREIYAMGFRLAEEI